MMRSILLARRCTVSRTFEVVASTAKVAIFERRTFKTTQSAQIAFRWVGFSRTTSLC